MPWNVTYNPSLNIIEEVFQGPVTGAEFREAVTARIALEKETSATRVLNDVSEIEVVASVFDILSFPDKQYPQEGSNRKIRMALVSPGSAEAKEMSDFFITVCLNRGW